MLLRVLGRVLRRVSGVSALVAHGGWCVMPQQECGTLVHLCPMVQLGVPRG